MIPHLKGLRSMSSVDTQGILTESQVQDSLRLENGELERKNSKIKKYNVAVCS